MALGGLALAQAISSSPEWTDFTGGVASMSVFVVVPGLLGLTIGSAIPRWKTAWERPGGPAQATR